MAASAFSRMAGWRRAGPLLLTVVPACLAKATSTALLRNPPRPGIVARNEHLAHLRHRLQEPPLQRRCVGDLLANAARQNQQSVGRAHSVDLMNQQTLSGHLRLYAEEGRPSIPPERLLKASLLMSLYSVRSERAFCEELDYHLLFRWFLDMDLVEPSFDHSTFTKNRERLLGQQVSREFFDAVVRQADQLHLLSDEHFTVDGTLIEAAASLKSFRPRDEPPPPKRPDGGSPSNRWVDFHGEKRSNATHQSTTDPGCAAVSQGSWQGSSPGVYGPRSVESKVNRVINRSFAASRGDFSEPGQQSQSSLRVQRFAIQARTVEWKLPRWSKLPWC